MSAPPKEQTEDDFLQEMVDILSKAATKDVILDRSFWGEIVWSQVYGRKSKLSPEGIEILQEIEESVGTKRILMHDNNVEAHWQRCVDNKEPMTKVQFVKAKSLFSQLAQTYGFELITLPQFLKQYPDAAEFNKPQEKKEESVGESVQLTQSTPTPAPVIVQDGKTAEQLKLEKANAINDILSKRILKNRSPIFDDLENEIRSFLNSKLANIFGQGSNSESLTADEIKFYKLMFKKAKEKGETR